MPISLPKIFSEYKQSLGQAASTNSGFPQTFQDYSTGLSTPRMQSLYKYAKDNYTTGVPKTYADFLAAVEAQIPKESASRLTADAVKDATSKLGLHKMSPEQAKESLRFQGKLLTEMPADTDIETPTGLPRISPVEITTGLVGMDQQGNLPSPTITSGLNEILPQQLEVPAEGSFIPSPATRPSPTLQEPTALGTKVTRDGKAPHDTEASTTNILASFGTALARGAASSLDAIGGMVESLINFDQNLGIDIADLTTGIIADSQGEYSAIEEYKKYLQATKPVQEGTLSGYRSQVLSTIGDTRIYDLDIKNPLLKSALSGVEQFIETIPDLALIIGTRSPQAAQRLGAEYAPEVADFLFKQVPKTPNVATKAIGKLLGESVTTPNTLKALQVDWIQPFKAAAKSDFAVWLGAKEASLSLQDTSADTIGGVGEGIKAFGTGYVNGLFFEKIGITPVKLASSIAIKTGTPIAGLASNVIGSGAVGFAGDVLLQASEQVAEGMDISPDYYQALAAGVAFGGATALHGRTLIANTKAGIRAEQWRNIAEMENKTIDYCLNKSYDAATLNAKIDDIYQKREALVQRMDRTMDAKGKYKATDVNQLMAIDAQASAYRQVLLTQSMTKEIVQNPDRFRQDILDNGNLTADTKTKLLDKIDSIVQEFDPINIESRRLQEEVANLDIAKMSLDQNDPLYKNKVDLIDKKIVKARDRQAELEINPTYYYKGEFYDTHGALIDAINKRYTDGTSSEIIVRNDPQGNKLVDEALNQLLDRRFNDGLKVAQKQATTKAKNQPMVDEAILVNQQRLNLPSEPEVLVSEKAVSELDKALAGSEANLKMVQSASDQLYGEAKRLESMKDADSRQFTIEQIENAQRKIYEDVAFAESYLQAKKAGESIDITKLKKDAAEAANEAILDVRNRRQVLLPEEVRAELNTPKPEPTVETKVEPVKPIEDATKERIIQQDSVPQREQVDARGVPAEAGRSNIPTEGRKATPEKEVTTWEELPVSEYVVLGAEGKPMVAGKERRAAIAREERSVRTKLLEDYTKAKTERESAMRDSMVNERMTEWLKANPEATDAVAAEQRKVFTEEASKATLAKAGTPLTDADIILGARLAASYMREGVKKSADLFKEISDNLKGALGVELSKQDFNKMMATSIPEYGKAPKAIVKELFAESAKTGVKRQIEEITGIRRKPDLVLKDSLKEARARYKELERVSEAAEKVGIKEGKLEMKEAAFDKQGYRDQLNQWLTENKSLIREVNPELTTAAARAINKVDSWYTLDRALNQIKKAISSKEYADRMAEQERLTKQVEKNLSADGKSKFGTAQDKVSDFLKIDADALPVELRPQYAELLSELATRKAEVPFDPFRLNQFIYNAKAQVDEGYAAYREKQIAKAIKKEIAAKDVDKKMSVAEIETERRKIYSGMAETSVKSLSVRKGKLNLGDRLSNELREYTATDLERLPSTVLVKLPLMVEKINAGVTPAKLYQEVIRPVRSYKNDISIMEAHGKEVLSVAEELNLKVDEVRTKLEADMQNTGLNAFQKLRLKDALVNKPRYLLDAIFQGAKKGAKPFYDTIISNSATNKTRAEANATRYKVNNTQLWSKAYRAREKAKGDRFDSAFLQAMYLKSLEYEANKGVRGAHSPADYFRQLTDYRKTYGLYTEQNVIRMKEWWSKIQDGEGNVTPESVSKYILPEEMAAIDNMRKWYSTEGFEKTREAEIIYRGGYLETYADYSHNFIIGSNNLVTPEQFVDQVFGGHIQSNMSVRSATSFARSGQTGVLNIDPVSTFNRAVESTYYDYYMTPAIQEAVGSFKIMQDMATDKKFRDALLSIEEAYKNDVSIAFENAMRQTTNIDKMMNAMGGAFYSGALASVRRVPQELLSNLSSALIYDPASFIEGSKAVKLWQKNNIDPTKYSASGYEELFDFAGVQNRFRRNVEDAQRLFTDTGMAGHTIRTGKWDRTVDMITNNQVKNTFDTFNRSVISLSDDLVGTRFFVGRFRREYEKLSGEKFDIDKFVTEDGYRFENEANIMQAAREASYHANLMTNTANTLEGIQALKVRGTSATQLFRDINNVLSGFSRHEASVMSTALRSGVSTGVLSTQQAVALFSAVTARNIIYNTALEFGARAAWAGVDDDYTVSNALYDVFGKDQLARQTAGAWLQIGIGSRGNLLRLPLQFGLSQANRWVTENMIGEDFDPDRHKLGMEGPDIVQATSSLYNFTNQLGPYQLPIQIAIEGTKALKGLSEEEMDADARWQQLSPIVWGVQKSLLPLPLQRDMEGLMKQAKDIMDQDGDFKELFTPERLSPAIVGQNRTDIIQQQMEEARVRNKGQ